MWEATKASALKTLWLNVQIPIDLNQVVMLRILNDALHADVTRPGILCIKIIFDNYLVI